MFQIAVYLGVCFLVLIRHGAALPIGKNKLIYIMLDGFRYDYVDDQPRENLPGFSRFLENGVRAEYMSPIYPSISYPDWTTLVTGLYAESHGIVGNYFYDAEDKQNFSLFDANSTGQRKWWTSEPIWTTASKANLRTAVILWSRCDIPFDGITPDFCEPFVSIKGPNVFRGNIEKAISKLQEGYDFIMVYNEHADNVGHAAGPETEERRQAVRDLDAAISQLLRTLEQINMIDQVNIVIVSDHGMTTTRPGTVNRVELDQYLLPEYIENIAGAGAFSNIKVREGHVDEVYNRLRGMPGVEVYKHDDIPEELHFKDNKYIHDIILKANIDTWIMKSNGPFQLPPRDNAFVYNGAHGFDPMEEKMRAIFFASGPDFKNGSNISAIKNVDVYPLLTHLLGLRPQPNNGTFDNIKMALAMESSDSIPEDRTTTTTTTETITTYRNTTYSGVSQLTGTLLSLLLAVALRIVY